MNIAIDISPLQTGHKVRGVGFYLQHLQRALEEYFPEDSYTYFTQKQKIPKDINVVHYPYFEPFFQTIPLLKKNKTIITIHDLIPLIFPEHFPAGVRGKLMWQMQKHLLKQIDAVVTDSHSSKKDILRLVGLPEHKVHVVYLAAGEEFQHVKNQESKIKLFRKKYQLPERFVLYVGDVTWNKNLPRLINAMNTTEIPLVMVGKALVNEHVDEMNPWNADLVKIHQRIKEKKHIIRLGFVSTDDLVMLYNMATVFVMPSLYEGFGLPILEAMSCGAPVVTTKESSLPEVAGNAAYFVNAYAEEDIRRGIQEVFTHSSLQRTLSDKGLAQAKKFSWKKTAEQTIEVYKEVMT